MIEKAGQGRRVEYAWGELEWRFAEEGPAQISSARMLLRAGHESPLHRHPGCEELLHLLEGQVSQRIGDAEQAMSPGDTAFIPAGVPHRSRALGTGDAVLLVAYSLARRTYEELDD